MPGHRIPVETRLVLAVGVLLARSDPRRPEQWRSHCTDWWFFNRDVPGARGALLFEAIGLIAADFRRRDPEEGPGRLRTALGHPITCVGYLALAAGLTGLLTHGFQETRARVRPTTLDSRAVMLTNPEAWRGYSRGVATSRYFAWHRYQTSLDKYAAYVLEQTSGGARIGRVEPAFFDVLGLKAATGQTFSNGDCQDCAVSAKASYVGDKVRIDGRWYRVVGSLPPEFRFGSARPAFWIPFEWGHAPEYVGVVGLLHRGRTVESAARDLGVGVAPLSRLERDASYVYLSGFLLAFAFALFQLVRDRAFWAHLGRPVRSSWRFWSFFFAKTAAVLTLVLVIAIESRQVAAMTTTGAPEPLLQILSTCPVAIAFGAALWWSWVDQRRRCQACLRRLTLPVHMGNRGASLLAPTGIEYACPSGHGALYEPDTPMEDAVWISLDEFFYETHQ